MVFLTQPTPFLFPSFHPPSLIMNKQDMKSATMDDKLEIQTATLPSYDAPKAKAEQIENACAWESENLIHDLERELEQSGHTRGIFDLEFKNPKHFTWLLVIFASMGGLLSGLDQSLISGANLTLPKDLHLTDQQNSLVNSGMPLGGKLTPVHRLGNF